MRSRTRDQVLNALPIGSDQVARGTARAVGARRRRPGASRSAAHAVRERRVCAGAADDRDQPRRRLGLRRSQLPERPDRGAVRGSALQRIRSRRSRSRVDVRATPTAARPRRPWCGGRRLSRRLSATPNTCARRAASRRFVERTGTPVFEYSFDYEVDPVAGSRVIHGLEVNLLFGNNFGAPSNYVLGEADRDVLPLDGRLLGAVRGNGNPERRRRLRGALAGLQAPDRAGTGSRQASRARRAESARACGSARPPATSGNRTSADDDRRGSGLQP